LKWAWQHGYICGLVAACNKENKVAATLDFASFFTIASWGPHTFLQFD